MDFTNRAVNRLFRAASIVICAAVLVSCACTPRNEGQGIRDETHWSKSQPIVAVNQMRLECEFDESFPPERAQLIEDSLLQKLRHCGFEISKAAPHCLRVRVHPIVQGSRGLPTSSRYCKVSVDVALVELAENQELVRGHIDGVIDETAYGSSERENRQDRAFRLAIGKVGRELYRLRDLPPRN